MSNVYLYNGEASTLECEDDIASNGREQLIHHHVLHQHAYFKALQQGRFVCICMQVKQTALYEYNKK